MNKFDGSFYGVPSRHKFKGSRNWFCHNFPTVCGYGGGFGWAIQGSKAKYEELLPPINHAITLLADLLKGDTAWEEPLQKLEPESETEPRCVDWGDETNLVPGSQDEEDKIEPICNSEVQHPGVKSYERFRSIVRCWYKGSTKVREMIDWVTDIVADLRKDFEYYEAGEECEEFQEACDKAGVAW